MGVISKNTVLELMVPFLSVGKRGFKSKLCMANVVLLILKRVKTGCQWRELCIKEYFEEGEVTWQTIYYYFNKWSKDGSFKNAWTMMLEKHKHLIDLSTAQLDGSHTPSKRGGEAVGYQGRKSCKTSNVLVLSDNNGIPIAIGEPQDGKQNDMFNLEEIFAEMAEVLGESTVSLKGVFMNADAGFDCDKFKAKCEEMEIELNVKANKRGAKESTLEYEYFDTELYNKNRYKVEQSNAWMDAYKGILVRYEKLLVTWRNMLWLCITAICIKKIKV